MMHTHSHFLLGKQYLKLQTADLKTMLSNPVLEGAVNPEAADMLWSSPSTYHRVVLDCVKASQELESE
ncbi:unnamed protein product [Coregonus sp. 'balchen']|nr:unnamed protein product [Coregonus sp. 'balchen']